MEAFLEVQRYVIQYRDLLLCLRIITVSYFVNYKKTCIVLLFYKKTIGCSYFLSMKPRKQFQTVSHSYVKFMPLNAEVRAAVVERISS